ncbi:DSD1 family PLP-dependent enzyme [Simiduia curdlanivorans]|uniref:DSD1 family PLP-dependent enzyme n=1 Tax=Simiduia curdlanivorans TaxID=1492769 RepID=A0ABV8V8X0_9GAMM|nr:DSD1 family PLP-dependent enzyme [Simiduia curdlanivorans]MDN3639021.1 DSD1 family PLP-dependent enzyme [Simiduia curdlanivorans]
MSQQLSRRHLLLGSLAGAGALWLLRPSDKGENHTPYFKQLGAALSAAQIATPTLIIDQQKLDANIATLKRHIQAQHQYRIVAKSLPSIPLLSYIMQATKTRRLMVFNQPFLNQITTSFPDADVLMGKPMPVQAAKNFYRQQDQTANTFDPSLQLQWLIDTPARLNQYQALAHSNNQVMRINIEIDVGLHRGGVTDENTLSAMIDQIETDPLLALGGLMGYEPHIAKLPGSVSYWQDQAMQRYLAAVDLLVAKLGAERVAALTLNCGGSPTYQLYSKGNFPFNELSAGSCLVKPQDFDLASLADHNPASYIATPLLKQAQSTQIPGIDLGTAHALWDPNKAQSFFIYGGYWKATPLSPKGLSNNGLYGRSTNQELLNGSTSISLAPDDWIFLRPNQSEFVFLQFGDIALYDGETISQRWPVFANG